MIAGFVVSFPFSHYAAARESTGQSFIVVPERSFAVDTKKKLFLFAVIFPFTFVIGVLVSFVLSLQFQEHVDLNWLLVFAIAILFDLGITWRFSRDQKDQQQKA
jgi:putative flippase GtrA